MARECIPTPIVGNGLIYAVSGPNSSSYAVRPGGRGDVTDSHVIWTYARGNPYVPSAILVGDRYYLVDDHGIATCLDAATGRPKWRKRLGGDFTASPVSAEGRIYFTNEAGSTVVVRAGGDSYEELARNEIGEPVFASAAISTGRLFLERKPTVVPCQSRPVAMKVRAASRLASFGGRRRRSLFFGVRRDERFESAGFIGFRSASVTRTMKAAAPGVFSISAKPVVGPITLTAVSRLSAVMQSGAITVTPLRSVRPRPVCGSTMCE